MTVSVTVQKDRLTCVLQSMYDEGIVNDQFFQLQSMKEVFQPDYVVRTIINFCTCSVRLFISLTDEIYKEEVDFAKVGVLTRELYGKTSRQQVMCSVLVQWDGDIQEICLGWIWLTKDIRLISLLAETLGRATYFIIEIQHDEVNGRFSQIVSLNTTGEHNRVVQLINKYIADVDVILDELNIHVDRSEADYSKVASIARAVEEKSRSIGAEHMRLACYNLIKACDEKDKRSFITTLPWVRREFSTTRSKLDAFVQMERRIIRFENPQSPN